jgi:hypothetical protein
MSEHLLYASARESGMPGLALTLYEGSERGQRGAAPRQGRMTSTGYVLETLKRDFCNWCWMGRLGGSGIWDVPWRMTQTPESWAVQVWVRTDSEECPVAPLAALWTQQCQIMQICVGAGFITPMLGFLFLFWAIPICLGTGGENTCEL